MSNTSWYHKHKNDPEFREKREKYRKLYEKKNRKRITQKNAEWRKKHPNSQKDSYYKCKLSNPEKFLLRQAKNRAKNKNLEFNLKLHDIVIPEKCPIMDVKLEYIPHQYSDYSPSVDRIDNTKGYTKDNIQIISSIANRMKWTATKEQLLQFAHGILKLGKGG